MARRRPIQLEDLFRLKVLGRCAVSPDGRSVVFEVKRFDLDENKNLVQLMIVDAESGDCRHLTSGKHADTRPQWSHDGREIGFLSNRDKGVCLYVLPMGGGEPRRLTEPDGFVQDFAWSPNGKRIVYVYQPMNEREKLERDGKDDEVRKRPQFKHITRLFHKLDGAGWWNGNYTHVWITDADGGRRKQLTDGSYDDREPRFSPDGRLVSFVSNRLKDPDRYTEHADIYTVKPTGGAATKITRMPGPCAGHGWSPDGKWIAFVGSPAKAGEGHKYLERIWLVPSGGGKERELTKEVGNNCRNLTLGDVTSAAFEAHAPIWSADSARVFFPVSEAGATRVHSRSITRNDLRCEVDGDVNVYSLQRTNAEGPIALSLGTAVDPGDVYLLDPRAVASPRRLTELNKATLAAVSVAVPELFTVRSSAVNVHGWVLKPPGFNPRRKYPAILQIHGGPHAQYGASFYHELQWMAAKGYVVVYSNPRGSVGYGLGFQNCIHADWGNLDYQDVMKVADWMVARPYVDKRRVGVTGGSYGGYMTNWLVGHTDRFKAAVTQRSVVNLESMFGTSDYGFELGLEFGGLPWENLQRFRRQSPLTYVKNIRTPLLIEHEEQDHRCSIEQAEQLFLSLKSLGRTVEFIRFEGESHGLCRTGRPQNRAERLRRIMGWFDQHLGRNGA